MIPNGKKEFNGFLVSNQVYHRTEMPPTFRLDDQEIAQSEDLWEQPQAIGLFLANGQVESIYTFENSDSES